MGSPCLCCSGRSHFPTTVITSSFQRKCMYSYSRWPNRTSTFTRGRATAASSSSHSGVCVKGPRNTDATYTTNRNGFANRWAIGGGGVLKWWRYRVKVREVHSSDDRWQYFSPRPPCFINMYHALQKLEGCLTRTTSRSFCVPRLVRFLKAMLTVIKRRSHSRYKDGAFCPALKVQRLSPQDTSRMI